MICIVTREERSNEQLVDKITKLGATMMTEDLRSYGEIAKKTLYFMDFSNGARKNPENIRLLSEIYNRNLPLIREELSCLEARAGRGDIPAYYLILVRALEESLNSCLRGYSKPSGERAV